MIFVGVAVSLVKRLTLFCCGASARSVELATGVIGTPIHELSHAFFCLIFFHRIKKISLLSLHSEDGRLGCVVHTYRKYNLWQLIGNFFIGIAPLLGGTLVLFLLLWWLLPEAAETLLWDGALFSFDGADVENVSYVAAWISALWERTLRIFGALFSLQNFTQWHFYLYLLLAIPIVLHMEISPSDLKSSGIGLVFLLTVLLSVDSVLLIWFPETLSAWTGAFISFGIFVGAFFLLAIFVSCLLILLSLLLLLLRWVFGRR